MLWRSDATDAQIDAVFAPDFTDHRPGADGAGVNGFREHWKAAFEALSGLSARYEPVASAGRRLAAHATVAGVHSGEFLGVAATGPAVSFREGHPFEGHDWPIAGHRTDPSLPS